jgi:hypothetical protein
VFISYSTRAKEAIDLLANFDRAAYFLALTRVQGWLASVEGDGMVEAMIRFTVDDETYTVAFAATVLGAEVTVHELGWEVAGI